MKVSSKIGRGVVSKLISNFLRKKTGYDVKMTVNQIGIFELDNNVHAHIDVDAELTKEQFENLMKQFGLA